MRFCHILFFKPKGNISFVRFCRYDKFSSLLLAMGRNNRKIEKSLCSVHTCHTTIKHKLNSTLTLMEPGGTEKSLDLSILQPTGLKNLSCNHFNITGYIQFFRISKGDSIVKSKHVICISFCLSINYRVLYFYYNSHVL